MNHRRVDTRPRLRIGVLLAIAIAAAACSSPSGGATTPSLGPSAASSIPTLSATPPASTALASTPASYGSARVDLVVTGARSAEAHGTVGCQAATSPSGARIFFWEAGEHDYPTLYDGMIVGENSVATGDAIDVKWVVRGSITYKNAAPIPYAGDGHTVTLDADLTGVEGTVHVQGSITCP